MRGSDENLAAKQERAVAALLAHPTIAKAAKASGVAESTLYRWLSSDETFRAAYLAARRAVVDHAVTQLQRDAATASKTLREVCEDGSAPASARVAAAKIILDGAVKAVELQDLAARLEELERRLPQKKGDHR